MSKILKWAAAVILVGLGVYCAYVVFHNAKRVMDRAPIGIGVHGNVPDNAPGKKDLKVFSIPVPGKLSRSGQPTMKAFTWLHDKGWKSVIDLRQDGEKGDPLDTGLPGFEKLGFRFLSIQVPDGDVPTEAQVIEFLRFMDDPDNLPAHIHCAAGEGRTGIFVAIYRYSIEGYTMQQAIDEMVLSRPHKGGINEKQALFLNDWAKRHKPGADI
ncbi:hypothetical protein HGB24_03165 [Candidatus Saccharibacteria bacterium]|nr:hypothetical protein [Candidatus Saccharibacteria bacterium]